jgi:5-methylcytosine-specific restriction endonuclease McrA
MKTCNKCGVSKSLDSFAKDGNGRRNTCKECRQNYNKTYYVKNRDTVLVKRKAYREANAEDIKSYKAAYRKANPELNRYYKSVYKNRLLKLDPKDALISREYRKAIAKDSCRYCGAVKPIMHDDHYFPVSKGGSNIWYNFVRACKDCNESKWNRCGTWFLLR